MHCIFLRKANAPLLSLNNLNDSRLQEGNFPGSNFKITEVIFDVEKYDHENRKIFTRFKKIEENKIQYEEKQTNENYTPLLKKCSIAKINRQELDFQKMCNEGKTKFKQLNVIRTANTIFSKDEKTRQKNLKPGVEQMQLGEFNLKKDSECKKFIIKIGLENINLGTQPVSQSPETLTIAGQQFRLYNVPGDGNCGVWAFLQAWKLWDCANPTQERIGSMLEIRQKVANLAKERNANETTRERIGTAGNWLSTDDFRYFAQYANQDIVVIIDDGHGNYQYETYYANGNADAAVNGLPTEYNPINNRLYIYYRNGHFQTLLLEPSMKRGGEAIQGIGNWEDWEDSDKK